MPVEFNAQTILDNCGADRTVLIPDWLAKTAHFELCLTQLRLEDQPARRMVGNAVRESNSSFVDTARPAIQRQEL